MACLNRNAGDELKFHVIIMEASFLSCFIYLLLFETLALFLRFFMCMFYELI